LVLTAGIRALSLFVYAGMGLLFLLAAVFPQGRKFVPATLLSLPFWLGAVLVQPGEASGMGAVLLAAALALLAVAIQDERAGAVQAGLRVLATAVLSLPFFLVAAWLAESQSALLAGTVGRSVIVGGLILFAAFPFHVWATTSIREASPLAWLLLFGLAQAVVLTFVFGWLPTGLAEPLAQLVAIAGAVTLLVAILLLVTAQNLIRLIAGALLVDMACVVFMLAHQPGGWEAAVTVQIARFASLLLISLALLSWQWQSGRPTEMSENGLAWCAPFTTAGLLFGCLSLLGLPLTVGFGGRWLVLAGLVGGVGVSWGTAVLLLLAMGLGTLAFLRVLPLWLTRPDNPTQPALTEPRWLQATLGIALLAALWLSLQPQLLLGYAARLAASFGN
jgi:NADH:ubiquinone oxidoreductase subunit 2 (subunit N)